jgi:hypothetical protein
VGQTARAFACPFAPAAIATTTSVTTSVGNAIHCTFIWIVPPWFVDELHLHRSSSAERAVCQHPGAAAIRVWHPVGMPIVLAAGIVAAALAAAFAGPSATVTLSSNRAATRPVQLTLKLHYEMQCSWPGQGPLTLRLPGAMTVPTTIPPAAILIDGDAAKHVGGSGHRIVLNLPPRPQILCDAIAPGTLVVRFTAAARLGNPKLAGSYRVRATKGSLAFSAPLQIHSR